MSAGLSTPEALGGGPGVEFDPTISQRAFLARQMLNPDAVAPVDILDAYAANDANTAPQEVIVSTDQSSVKVLYLSELLIGYQDSDIAFARKVAQNVIETPEESRPDAVVFSGAIMGNFQGTATVRKATLVPGLDSLDSQFSAAKSYIDTFTDAGVPVVYSLSDNDHRIIKEANAAQMRKLQSFAKEKVPDDEGFPAWQIGVLQQSPVWLKHLEFQRDVAFPFRLRNGRDLRSEKEIEAVTGGEVKLDEYMVLHKVTEDIKNGVEPDKKLVDVLGGVASLEDNEGLIIVDDLDLRTQTSIKERLDWVRHTSSGVTPESAAQNHVPKRARVLGGLVANGHFVPNTSVEMGSFEFAAVTASDGRLVMSTGALIDPRKNLHRDGARSTVPGDTSSKLVKQRGRLPSPSAIAHERTDDGSHRLTIYNEALMEKSFSLPDQVTIMMTCDWQTGSITARPDYQVKAMDMLREELDNGPVAAFAAGDMIHGRNYKNFPVESQQTGLMSVESQSEFVVRMLEGSFDAMSPAQVDQLVKVAIEPGNHEWNTEGGDVHGDSFTRYLRDAFTGLYIRSGLTQKEAKARVTFNEALVTDKGEFFTSYTSSEKLGEYGITSQHFALARGGKGSGGGLPIYQSEAHAAGVSDVDDGVDIKLGAHWHHAQAALAGDKLAVISGSLAGMSGYEYWRGYRPVISIVKLRIGGGKPPELEIIPEEALINHKIKDGPYSDAALKKEGYVNDRNWDPVRDGFYAPTADYPSSALQKYLRALQRDVSQSGDSYGTIGRRPHLRRTQQSVR